MLDRIKDGTEIGTSASADFNDLKNAYLASELGVNTQRIIAVLSEDENKEPHKLISKYVAENPQTYVWIEIDKKYLRAHILDRNNEEAGCTDISTNPKNIFCETVSQNTYDSLMELSFKEEEAQARVDEKVKNAI